MNSARTNGLATTRVYRKGRGSRATLGVAILCWAGAALIFWLLSIPETAPAALLRLFWDIGRPAPTPADRLLGLALALGVTAIGIFCLRVAPFLGGQRITLDEQGVEYVDHQSWVAASWSDVESITSAGESAQPTYTVNTRNGSFSFNRRQIDNADDLAATIRARVGPRR